MKVLMLTLALVGCSNAETVASPAKVKVRYDVMSVVIEHNEPTAVAAIKSLMASKAKEKKHGKTEVRN